MGRLEKPEISTQVREGRYFFLHEREGRRSDLMIVCGGRERCSADYRIDRATFPYYALEWVEQGEGELWLGRRKYPLRPATVFCYGPGIAIRMRSTSRSPLTKCFLDVTGAEALAVLALARLKPGGCLQLAGAGELGTIFDEIRKEALRDGPELQPILATYLRLLALKIRSARSSASPRIATPRETFLQARQFFQDHARTCHSVEAMGKTLGLTASYLCRLFREHGEISPYQYLIRLRMNLALDMLLTSSGQIKQVSFACGFRDPAHFSRLFKRVHGFSPSELLKRTDRARTATIID